MAAVDEAHLLANDQLEQLRLLTNEKRTIVDRAAAKVATGEVTGD